MGFNVELLADGLLDGVVLFEFTDLIEPVEFTGIGVVQPIGVFDLIDPHVFDGIILFSAGDAARPLLVLTSNRWNGVGTRTVRRRLPNTETD